MSSYFYLYVVIFKQTWILDSDWSSHSNKCVILTYIAWPISDPFSMRRPNSACCAIFSCTSCLLGTHMWNTENYSGSASHIQHGQLGLIGYRMTKRSVFVVLGYFLGLKYLLGPELIFEGEFSISDFINNLTVRDF